MVQAKKVRRVQSAFELFNRMMQTPGKSELTLTELRVRPLNPACITAMLDCTVPLPHLVPVELTLISFVVNVTVVVIMLHLVHTCLSCISKQLYAHLQNTLSCLRGCLKYLVACRTSFPLVGEAKGTLQQL